MPVREIAHVSERVQVVMQASYVIILNEGSIPYFPEYKSHLFTQKYKGKQGGATHNRARLTSEVNILLLKSVYQNNIAQT